jgi:hypothetical protein
MKPSAVSALMSKQTPDPSLKFCIEVTELEIFGAQYFYKIVIAEASSNYWPGLTFIFIVT